MLQYEKPLRQQVLGANSSQCRDRSAEHSLLSQPVTLSPPSILAACKHVSTHYGWRSLKSHSSLPGLHWEISKCMLCTLYSVDVYVLGEGGHSMCAQVHRGQRLMSVVTVNHSPRYFRWQGLFLGWLDWQAGPEQAPDSPLWFPMGVLSVCCHAWLCLGSGA